MRKDIKKQRLDIFLVETGYFASRTAAQAEIMAGNVEVDGQIIIKPSFNVGKNDNIEIKEKNRFVSRGAYKLLKAIEDFGLDVKGKVCLDAGTATGGFAQVLLENDAKKVVAVDVGYGQFDYRLRQDPRIELYERTNIRYFNDEHTGEFGIVVADLSFISLSKVIDKLISLSKDDADLVLLIKPQFEADIKLVKKGVVRESQVHKQVISGIVNQLQKKGLKVYGLTFSPIKGPKGNIEFFVYFKKGGKGTGQIEKVIDKTVEEAHSNL